MKAINFTLLKSRQYFKPFIYSSIIIITANSFAQNNETKSKLLFTSDFRFRIEQDWNSKKSDGSFRDDKSRLRYRIRFGAKYDYNEWVTFGMRLRTGEANKQQDPHLTLGDGSGEFSTIPVGFEKIYTRFKYNWFTGWVGKNTFPFEKQNELFWGDNVYPEGISLSGKFSFSNKFLQTLQINTGHFILKTRASSFAKDSYFQGIQLVSSHLENIIKIFPAFYYFNSIPDIPDGNDTYSLNYAIAHLGAKITLVENPKITFGIDYFDNIKNYDKNASIPQAFKNQTQGLVSSISIGSIDNKGDFKFQISYAYMERFSAIDFLAQNDWARWDYSNQGSPDSRLTNFKGFEIVTDYALGKKMDLKLTFFTVKQLISYGSTKETGDRIRLDLNIGF